MADIVEKTGDLLRSGENIRSENQRVAVDRLWQAPKAKFVAGETVPFTNEHGAGGAAEGVAAAR